MVADEIGQHGAPQKLLHFVLRSLDVFIIAALKA